MKTIVCLLLLFAHFNFIASSTCSQGQYFPTISSFMKEFKFNPIARRSKVKSLQERGISVPKPGHGDPDQPSLLTNAKEKVIKASEVAYKMLNQLYHTTRSAWDEVSTVNSTMVEKPTRSKPSIPLRRKVVLRDPNQPSPLTKLTEKITDLGQMASKLSYYLTLVALGDVDLEKDLAVDSLKKPTSTLRKKVNLRDQELSSPAANLMQKIGDLSGKASKLIFSLTCLALGEEIKSKKSKKHTPDHTSDLRKQVLIRESNDVSPVGKLVEKLDKVLNMTSKVIFNLARLTAGEESPDSEEVPQITSPNRSKVTIRNQGDATPLEKLNFQMKKAKKTASNIIFHLLSLALGDDNEKLSNTANTASN